MLRPLKTIVKVLLSTPDDGPQERRQKFVVGLRFRAIVSLAFALLFVFLSRTGFGPTPPLAVLLSLLALLSALNVLYWSIGARRGFPLRDFYAHWFLDLVLISSILFCLGGIGVPY